MGRLFPIRGSVDPDQNEPRLVGIDEEDADDVFAALSSRTSRDVLTALHEEPRTASDLAEAVDTSLQNARYHLDKLVDAGLVDVVDVWYSERGTEMKVYAPVDESLVVFAGESSTPGLRAVLKRVLGAFGALALASLLVERLDDRSQVGLDGVGSPDGAPGGSDGAAGTTASGIDGRGTDDATTAPETREPTGAGATSDGGTTGRGSVEDSTGPSGGDGGTDAATTAAETATEAVTTAADAATAATTTAVESAGGATTTALEAASPGLLFFAGGAFALALVLGWWVATR